MDCIEFRGSRHRCRHGAAESVTPTETPRTRNLAESAGHASSSLTPPPASSARNRGSLNGRAFQAGLRSLLLRATGSRLDRARLTLQRRSFRTPAATPTRTATAARPPRRCSTPAPLTRRLPPAVSHELLGSKHKSSSLAGIARSAAPGQRRSRRPRPSGHRNRANRRKRGSRALVRGGALPMQRCRCLRLTCARAARRSGEGDRAAGLALKMQIVAKRSRGVRGRRMRSSGTSSRGIGRTI